MGVPAVVEVWSATADTGIVIVASFTSVMIASAMALQSCVSSGPSLIHVNSDIMARSKSEQCDTDIPIYRLFTFTLPVVIRNGPAESPTRAIPPPMGGTSVGIAPARPVKDGPVPENLSRNAM